jgi:hypothetical protein
MAWRGVLNSAAKLMVRGLASDAKASKLSLENLKSIRSKTGLSISLCRQALVENSDDLAAALQWLDKNEAARAESVSRRLLSSCACFDLHISISH